MAGGGGGERGVSSGASQQGKKGGGGTGWVDGGTPAIVGEFGRALVLETDCRKVGLGDGVGGGEEGDDEVLEGEGELVDELEGLEARGEARKPLAELEQDVHFYLVASLTQDTDDVQGMERKRKVHSPICNPFAIGQMPNEFVDHVCFFSSGACPLSPTAGRCAV